MKTVIMNGTLVLPEGPVPGDLVLENGKIAKIVKRKSGGPEKPESYPEAEIEDATDMLVFPGFIDGHTHLDLPVSGTVTADDFSSGTRAAVCGGTTCVVDFATQDFGQTMVEAYEIWRRKADHRSSANYAFHMALSEWNDKIKAEFPLIREKGICSFKVYLAYAMRFQDDELYEALKAADRVGGIVGVHCENGLLVQKLQKEELAMGHTGTEAHPLSRPAELEAEAIDRLTWAAYLAGTPCHVVHLSSRAGLASVRRARARGQKVYAETCPQYLYLDESNYKRPDFEGAKYVMSPPLRKPEDLEAIHAAVVNGEIDTIATDHCSFNFATQKQAGREDFTKIPNGAPGIEHRPALIMTCFEKELAPYRLMQLLSENPAKLFGMYPQKGTLQEGSDADVTVWNPKKHWIISAANQHQNVDYTPYEGFEVHGQAHLVYVNGYLAAKDGEPTGEVRGEYVAR